ncbi:MAG: oligosaccharide flippase family protein [Solirubrobacterales bacterium]
MPDAPGAEAIEEEVEGEIQAEAAEAIAAEAGGDGEPDGSQMQPMFTGSHGVGARFAGRIGRHATAYGVASVSGMLAGLVSVAVFTRFLDQSEFGKMAVLSTVSTLVTLVATLGVMQGTMRRIYGTTGDDEAGDIDAPGAHAVAADPRLALSSGLALTVALGAVVFALAFALKGRIAGLFGGPGDEGLILLAAGAGAAGAVMRFSHNILRLQLRSGAYVVVTMIYAFGGIPVAIPLLEAGLGIEAILIGFIVANSLSAVICLLLLAADLRPAVSLREAKEIMVGGARYLPIVVSFQAVQMGDVLLVAAFGSFSQTGLYRVAQRIAMPVSYGTSVFQQSWGPLKRDMTHVAVDRVDEARTYAARLFTYYAVFVTVLILVVAVFADQLVRVASGDFGEAATLVPLTALGVAGHGWFVFSYRNARLPGQMYWMVGLSLASALVFVGLCVVLVPAMGAVGAPVAAIAAWGIATLVMLGANQLIGKPIPYEWRNLLLLGALTVLAWLVSKWVLPDTALGTVATMALLLGWAGALLGAGIVPAAEVRAVGRLVRDASGIDSRRQLRARIAALDGADAQLVDEIVRHKRPPGEVGERLGLSEEEAMARTVHVLRQAAGGGEAKNTDADLGALLLLPIPRAERDNGLMSMVTAGADPLDADLVKRAVAAAGSGRRRAGADRSASAQQLRDGDRA